MSLKKSLKSDLISGFLVFLIALPLCLGIAKASGFPPIAGIYTAVVGGLIVTFFTNSPLTIKGPAAGLIVIALGAVNELGQGDIVDGYRLTLAVIVVAGALQVVLGFLKSGSLSDFFPSSVIHGMLAAIGIIIISKQVHLALGVVPVSHETMGLIAEIPQSILNMNPEVAVIGLVSIIILFTLPLFKNKYVRLVPAPLVVLLIAIPMGLYFDLGHEHDYDLGSLHFHINPAQLLVALPSNFFSGITFPDFSQIFSAVSIKYIIMFSLVGSIESLLSAKAIDMLDPQKRTSNLDKDLVAVGLGNIVVGFIGGLPMISEIVRSSANINNGGKTKMSNFFHGLFLFLFALLAASFIQKIPNAALSAMLCYTGYKLASPHEFKRNMKLGYDQFAFFLLTLVATLLTDLLIGVIIGVLAKLIFHILRGAQFNELFKSRMFVTQTGDSLQLIDVASPLIFSNYLTAKSVIGQIPKHSHVVLDFSNSKMVDHSVMENLHHLEDEFSKNGGQLQLTGFDKHNFTSQNPYSSRRWIVNPNTGSHTNEELNKRQREIKDLAANHQLMFEPLLQTGFLRHNFATFSKIQRAKYGSNFILGNPKDFRFMIADIAYDKYDSLSKDSVIATVALLSDFSQIYIPDFVLEKDSLFTLLEELKGFERISFKNNQLFTDKYFLYGEEPNSIEKFFNYEMMSFLIKHDEYYIETRGQKILIHKYSKKLSINEVESLISFCKDLSTIMLKERDISQDKMSI